MERSMIIAIVSSVVGAFIVMAVVWLAKYIWEMIKKKTKRVISDAISTAFMDKVKPEIENLKDQLMGVVEAKIKIQAKAIRNAIKKDITPKYRNQLHLNNDSIKLNTQDEYEKWRKK